MCFEVSAHLRRGSRQAGITALLGRIVWLDGYFLLSHKLSIFNGFRQSAGLHSWAVVWLVAELILCLCFEEGVVVFLHPFCMRNEAVRT